MRIVPVTLAILCVACSSSTGIDNRNKGEPGPSMTGLWHAADTLQHYMTLQLTQADSSVSGSGWVDVIRNNVVDSTDTLTARGQNVIWPPCCQSDGVCPPCALLFPVTLTLLDTEGRTLFISGGFAPGDTNQILVQVAGEAPGFPFSFQMQPSVSLTFIRQRAVLQQRTGLPAASASRQARSR